MKVLGAVTLLVGALVAPAAPAAGQPVADELVHLGTEQVSPRQQVLSFSTAAVDGVTQVRVLLPEGYDPSGATRYPVLYLLHGGGGSSTRWIDDGAAEAITAGYPLIVVMPDGGIFGYYADWWNFGLGGAPQWETYHLSQLLPWVDAHYPTVAGRDGRAVAGESMGGLGAMHYAATRPDLFTAAASFSGAIDTNYLLAPPIVEVSAIAHGMHLPTAAFGPRLTEEVRWRGHNPVDLAENLQGLLLQFDVGTGMPRNPIGGQVDPVEMAMYEMATAMHARLDALGIEHLWNEYGPGCHCWVLWQRDLRQFLPRLMARFADPPPAPATFDHSSIEPVHQVWGWEVAIDRPALEFSRLADAGADGFALTGSGGAVVTTAPTFAPGQPVMVTVTDATGTTPVELVADDAGRLRVPVSLGPGNPYQQHSIPGAVWAALGGAPPGTWPSVTATATFEPLATATSPTPSPDDALGSGADAAAAPAPAAAAAPMARSLPATGGGEAGALLGGAVAIVLALSLRRTRRETEA